MKQGILSIFFYFLVCLSFVRGAANDSIKVTVPTSVKYILESDFRDGNPIYIKPDSSLYTTDQVNVAIDNQYNYLGVPGSAVQSLRFTDYTNITTHNGIRSYDLYFTKNDSIRYFNANKKYTDIQYHNGTFSEQVIDIFHSQNIVKGWNAGIKFSRFSVKDFMIFSDTYKGEFVFFTSYHSSNNRYHLFANGIWNSIENQMNGGLKSDSLFLYGKVDNVGIRSLAWKISDAKQNVRNRDFHFSQYYDIGGSPIDTSIKTKSAPTLRIHHEISFNRTSMAYVDPSSDSSFYSNFFYSSSTNDSLHSDEIRNQIALIVPADKQRNSALFRNWSVSVSGEYQSTKYEQLEKFSWHNFLLDGKIISKYDTSDVSAIIEAKYVLDGKDQGNYGGNFQLRSREYIFGSFGLKYENSKNSADQYLTFNRSNNFFWENSFTKINKSLVGLEYSLARYKFSVFAVVKRIDRALFINEFALPTQLNSSITIKELNLEKNFTWKSLCFMNKLTFQECSNKTEIHLTPFFSSHSLFMSKKLFGHKLLTDIGVNAAFNQAYYSDAFMPASSLFYLQNEMKTQGYLRFDLFIRAKIKSARIFLKMENVADNIGKKSYFLTPHYAMPGQVFRFGVSWRFFDQ